MKNKQKRNRLARRIWEKRKKIGCNRQRGDKNKSDKKKIEKTHSHQGSFSRYFHCSEKLDNGETHLRGGAGQGKVRRGMGTQRRRNI